jgi:hypothetical protein
VCVSLPLCEVLFYLSIVQAETEATEVWILLRLLILAIWNFICTTIGDSSCLLAAAAETGLECWFSLRIFWLILGRFFRNSFLPLALFVATSTKKKTEIQPYLNAVDSFFSNFYFYMSAGVGRRSRESSSSTVTIMKGRRLPKIRQLFRNWETGPKICNGQQLIKKKKLSSFLCNL